MYVPESFFQKLARGAFLFALACWLVRTGVCYLQSVWGWLVLLAVVGSVVWVFWKIRKHYRDTHF